MRQVIKIVGYTGNSSGVLPEHIFVLVDETQAASVDFDLQAALNAAPTKGEPDETDYIPILDSADSNLVKKSLFSSFRSKLKAFFDTLYAPIGYTSGVQSVTGANVNNTDPNNPVVNPTEINLGFVQNETSVSLTTTTSTFGMAFPMPNDGGTGGPGLMTTAQAVKLEAIPEAANRLKVFWRRATSLAPLTGGSPEVRLYEAVLIPAGTLAVGSIVEYLNMIQRAGANGIGQLQLSVNTSASLTGATLLWAFNMQANRTVSPFRREFKITSTGIVGQPSSGIDNRSDFAGGTVVTATFDTTVDNYLIFSINITNVLDSYTSIESNITGI